MGIQIKDVIGLVVAALLLGLLLPLALNAILGFSSTNSTVQNIVAVVLPTIAVIAIIMMFIPKTSKNS